MILLMISIGLILVVTISSWFVIPMMYIIFTLAAKEDRKRLAKQNRPFTELK